MVVDEGYQRYGVTAEIASVIQENAFFDLEAPVKRIGRSDGMVILRISPRPAAQAVQLTPISRFEKLNRRA